MSNRPPPHSDPNRHRVTPPQRDPEGPSLAEINFRARKARRQNFDPRFGNPAFNPQQFPKRRFYHRHPLAFQAIFVSVGLGIFFSKPLYDIFLSDAKPTAEDIERQEMLKKKVKEKWGIDLS